MGLRWPGAARQLNPIRIGSLCHECEELEAVHAIERRRPELRLRREETSHRCPPPLRTREGRPCNDGEPVVTQSRLTDSYIALVSFTTCGSWEGHYILNFLKESESDVRPDTIHADAQRQSTAIFGLAYLLGVKLMPRIRNWKDQNIFRPSAIYESETR